MSKQTSAFGKTIIRVTKIFDPKKARSPSDSASQATPGLGQ